MVKESIKRIQALVLAAIIVGLICVAFYPYMVRATIADAAIDNTASGKISAAESLTEPETDNFVKNNIQEEIKQNPDTEISDLQEGSLFLKNTAQNDAEHPLELTYGTNVPELEFELKASNDAIDEEIESYQFICDTTYISCKSEHIKDKHISIYPVNVTGSSVKAELKVKTANYVCSGELYVKVNPCALTIDTVFGVRGNDGREFDNTKIYDGTADVDVKVSLKAEDEQNLTDAAKKEIKGFEEVVFENIDCGIKNVSENGTEQTFTFAPSATSLASAIGSKNYTIKSTVEAKLTMKKRSLKLVVADTSRAFRSLTYETDLQRLVRVENKNDTQHTGFVNAEDQKKVTLPNVVDATVDSKIKNIKEEDTATWGKHIAALVLDETTGTVSENYVFDFQNYTKGDLNITEETDVESYVSINNTTSTHAYEDGDRTFYFGNDAVVKFSLGGDYNKIYEKEDTDVTNVTEEFKGLRAVASGESIERSFYLTRVESTENGPEITQKSAEFTLTFVYDKVAPECTAITFGTNNKVVTDLTTAITFGIYDKKQLEAEVEFTDHDLSGVKEWAYYVANTDKDKTFENLLKQGDYADDGSYEEALTSAKFTAGTDDHSIKVGKLQDGQTPEANTYIVFVKVKDNVGNSKIYGSNGVVLENYHDITVSFEEKSDEDLNEWNGRTYVKDALSLNLNAEEEGETYFTGLKQLTYKISRNGTESPEKIAENPKGFPEARTLTELKEFCKFTKTLEFITDQKEGSQVITVSASAEDNAGNGMDNPSEHTFVIDPIAPELISNCIQENHAGKLQNEIFANSPVTYTVTVKERFLKELKVYVNNDIYTLEQLENEKESLGIMEIQKDKVSDITRTTDASEYHFAIVFKSDGAYSVYTVATDAAGNMASDREKKLQFVIDTGVPKLKVICRSAHTDLRKKCDSPEWGKGVYSAKDKPGFDIEVTEPIVNGARAGLKKITYKIVNQTNGHTETGTLADEKTLKRGSHTSSWTGHVNIDPAKFYSNNVQVTVTAEDWSTNSETSKTLTLKVDNKAPVVKFTFDKSDVHNGKYYKNDKKLTITVEERNFDASYMPKVTSSAGGGYKISKWTHHGEIHTATITFTKDSDYAVSYDCYDLAGNKSKTEKLEEFTVDKTAPVIKVAYDNNSALNNSYYKAARTATITVTEHNFDPAKITVNTTASAGGAPKAGGWTNKGDTHTTRVTFDHDADYTFSVSGLDLAENKANEYGQDKFTVDLTDPEITISGVADKSANNGTVAPVVTIKDTNFMSSGAQVTLTGANRGEMKIKDMASTSVSATGMTVNFRDFAKNMDDIYTLTAKSADKAGNETVTTIQFSVNRDGSTYEISEKTKKLLEKVYTSVPEDIELTEINPNELKTIEISYSLDGKVVKLKEGTDYTLSRSGEEGQWKRYAYKINASCFEAEGSYVINIYSEDEANNVTTNKTKAKTVEFTVDKTAPTMVVTNLEDGGHYTEDTHEFTLNVKDNILLAYVELYMDGELVHTYEGDELMAANGELHITINGSRHQQTVELVSYDKVGNSSKEVYDPDTNQRMTAQYKVLVTSDEFVQFIHSVPRVIGTIVVLAAMIIFIILLIRRRKKNSSSQTF